jgi:hypothetical protein
LGENVAERSGHGLEPLAAGDVVGKHDMVEHKMSIVVVAVWKSDASDLLPIERWQRGGRGHP